MSVDFKGKVIAITGAASGIGLATAKLLASRGAILSLADANEPLLRPLTVEISSTAGQVTVTPLDVRNRSAVESWITSIVEHYGRLDGAANMAGVTGKQVGAANIEESMTRNGISSWGLI